ncbi:MAG: Asp-tRNA(Asn)/Glu-tRNA(Gln) amidotransferase subunit GatC [Candidatus Omnitrophota bacterium]
MEITREIVEYVAHLSRIELDSKELEKLSGQLTDILDFIDKLKKVDVTNIEPTSHILSINNVLRDDILAGSLDAQKALENAPDKNEKFFIVPKVIE